MTEKRGDMKKVIQGLFFLLVVSMSIGGCKRERLADDIVSKSPTKAGPSATDIESLLPPNEYKHLRVFRIPDGIDRIDDAELKKGLLKYMYYQVIADDENLYKQCFSSAVKKNLSSLKPPIIDAKQYARGYSEVSTLRYETVYGYEKISNGEAHINVSVLFQGEGYWFSRKSRIIFVKESDDWKYNGRDEGYSETTEITDFRTISILSSEMSDQYVYLRHENQKEFLSVEGIDTIDDDVFKMDAVEYMHTVERYSTCGDYGFLSKRIRDELSARDIDSAGDYMAMKIEEGLPLIKYKEVGGYRKISEDNISLELRFVLKKGDDWFERIDKVSFVKEPAFPAFSAGWKLDKVENIKFMPAAPPPPDEIRRMEEIVEERTLKQ